MYFIHGPPVFSILGYIATYTEELLIGYRWFDSRPVPQKKSVLSQKRMHHFCKSKHSPKKRESIRVPLLAARTLNATSQYRVTLSLR